MKKSFEIESNLMVECEGFYKSPTAAKFSHQFGNHLPGDHDYVSNFKVYVIVNGVRFEITSALTAKEREILETAFLEHCREDRSDYFAEDAG